MPELIQIRASAGSGKTYELTRGYLARLSGCAAAQGGRNAACLISPGAMACGAGEILAITFTNAAASEMRDRILLRLKEAALQLPGALPEIPRKTAEKWLEAVLHDMASLNIRTIDSLLHMIVRSSALELNIHPDFEPEFSSGDVIRPYLEIFLRAAKNDGEMRRRLEQACHAVLEQGSKGFLMGTKLSAGLSRVIDDCLKNRFAFLSSPDELASRKKFRQEQLTRAATRYIEAAKEENLVWKKEPLEIISSQAAGNYPLKQVTGDCASALFYKKTPPGEAVEAVHAGYMAAQDLYHPLRRAMELVPFIQVAELLTEAYKKNLLIEGRVPTSLIPLYAAGLLADGRGVSDALCRLGSRLTHFLLDEFQDTGREQWNVLRPLAHEALSRGGSLTCVGDVKQSIYGWRSADSALFDEVIEDAGLLSVSGGRQLKKLGTNRRSRRLLVEHTNTFFQSLTDFAKARELVSALLFSTTPADVIDIAAERLCRSYADLRQDCADSSGMGGYVHCESICGDNAEHRDALILQKLLEIMRGKIRGRRPWSDVLILTRSNDKAREAAKALIADGIPVITENSLLLAEHPLVIQTLGMLSFLANPRDDLAFWTFVTGSILVDHPHAAGLTVQGLHDWAAHNRQRPLYQAFSGDFPEIWQKLIEPFHNQAALLTPYDLVMEWYAHFDVERRFAMDSTILRRFMEVVQRAEEKGFTSIVSFLEYWTDKGGEEKAPMPEHMNAVRIMTIHKAKGLQAPVTIIPWTGFSLKPKGNVEVVEHDGLRIPVHVNSGAAGRLYHDDLANQALEAVNLLYVAMTRAEEELYFFHTSTKKKKNPVISLLAANGGYRLPYTLGELPPPTITAAGEPAPYQENTLPNCLPPDGNATWRPMQWLPRLKIFQNQLESDSLSAAERGIFLHFCLEHLQFGADLENDAQQALEFGLRHGGIHVPDNMELRRGLLAAIRWFASIPDARHWLANGWPEHSMLDENGRLMRADLIVPFSHGVLAIDYKSGEPQEGHARQIREYMRCLDESGSFPGIAQGLLVYLDKMRFRHITARGTSPLLRACPDFSCLENG